MSRPRRLDSRSYLGIRLYSLTICTHKRRPHFINPDTVARTLWQFLRVAVDEGFEIVAYCFMPDHVHVIAVATSAAADLRRLVGLAKQRTGFEFARTAGDRLWQEGFYERVVRSDQDLPALIAYLVENPVRAGLVTSPAEYPYWGSQVYSREEILEFVMPSRRR